MDEAKVINIFSRHDRENAPRLLFSIELPWSAVVIELPEAPCTVDLKRCEIIPAVRIIDGCMMSVGAGRCRSRLVATRRGVSGREAIKRQTPRRSGVERPVTSRGETSSDRIISRRHRPPCAGTRQGMLHVSLCVVITNQLHAHKTTVM